MGKEELCPETSNGAEECAPRQVTARPAAAVAPLPLAASLQAEESRASPSSPSSLVREDRVTAGSPASLRAACAPRALAQPVSNRRLRLLSFSTPPLLPPLFSFPLLPLSRLVTEVRPIAVLPAGAGYLLIGSLGARSRLRSSAGAGQTKDAGSGSGNRDQPIAIRPPLLEELACAGLRLLASGQRPDCTILSEARG